METIGFLELNSIAKGIEAADGMLKAAAVRLILARPNCPGKYNILICGEVAAVKASVDVGMAIGNENVVDSLIIPRVHPQVISAINLSTLVENPNAIGVIEFFSITGAILSADVAVKTADITLVEVRLGTGIGGKSFVVMTGEVAAVTESVSCGVAEGKKTGMLLNHVVIPSPRPEIFETLI